MRILIVTDAWQPQVNGVVRTLTETCRELTAFGHQVEMITPLEFHTLPCPTYPDIRLSILPYRQVAQRIAALAPHAIHIATEGPLGLAARRYCLRHKLLFTTAYHTRFPEYIAARTRLPLSISYAWMRRFHNAGAATMVPTQSIADDLRARGFKVVLWSRGVDISMFSPVNVTGWKKAGAALCLYRSGCGGKHRGFPETGPAWQQMGGGDGPLLARLQREYPEVHFAGVFPQPSWPASTAPPMSLSSPA
jgi:glycosyltransferase involved in cell wall biosynthesis